MIKVIKTYHHSRTLLVQSVESPELARHSIIPQYLIADLRPCGKTIVADWGTAWNAIQIDEEMRG